MRSITLALLLPAALAAPGASPKEQGCELTITSIPAITHTFLAPMKTFLVNAGQSDGCQLPPLIPSAVQSSSVGPDTTGQPGTKGLPGTCQGTQCQSINSSTNEAVDSVAQTSPRTNCVDHPATRPTDAPGQNALPSAPLTGAGDEGHRQGPTTHPTNIHSGTPSPHSSSGAVRQPKNPGQDGTDGDASVRPTQGISIGAGPSIGIEKTSQPTSTSGVANALATKPAVIGSGSGSTASNTTVYHNSVLPSVETSVWSTSATGNLSQPEPTRVQVSSASHGIGKLWNVHVLLCSGVLILAGTLV
ncbi:hypothetical protein CGCF415_v000724 [Colletotrichum fructicola]|uniref:Uncharacterized protein n=1 Tax=Colletotrichum fructicola (strain Nara gc5) TaxID=1213859 RepID=L2G4M9_COLFN|nr:uncharacterized protein CGMCC3_g14319 [Colletotrichum fructicola]KAF4485785.1 hypothetical protein CGGC5_v005654 [Colletotrichum fructicola Nara gc5]KAE9569554.1 hypothetical protein CGMCC3_g14319 [Colletotrichum fructicola]KAF4423823.1 hypothetical protein CFRS1_v006864 [Colletotrichum fructicola]KAF4889755.1 hypothetical protein CGCFRS4_v009110 [Colletotrichum fructicola]KAF4916639.1 hypothetical protein CGCF415_v000724 [Colletotrichum fructicola]